MEEFKMSKKIFAAVVSAIMLVCMAGCSDYVMTEKDIAKQRAMVGYWAANDSTGYNAYDADGNLTNVMVVQFTEDYKYLTYDCDLVSQFTSTYEPIGYTIEDENFRVDVKGVASYAKVTISDDGETMSWYTNEKTDIYNRLSEEAAAAMGIPEYDPDMWNTETNTSETEGESGE